MDVQEKAELFLRVAQAFSPSAPIDKASLFAGRTRQISDVITAVTQRGQHVILFGERGVGKTSLANVLSDFLSQAGLKGLDCGAINCDPTMDYSALWHAVFREMSFDKEKPTPGFTSTPDTEKNSLDSLLPEKVMPDDIRHVLQRLPLPAIIIIDEVDRIKDGRTKSLLADTIKNLSDHSIKTTLLLVGVADSVNELIEEHQSVERALVQVRMPRMSLQELFEIVDKGLSAVSMGIEEDAKNTIAQLSQGLPHYTHLLALHAAHNTIHEERKTISRQDVTSAIEKSLEGAQQSIISAYHKATSSPRENLYKQVLLACALAKADYLGYFSAPDVRTPMSFIMGKLYEIPAFSQHLKNFCEEGRGPILQRTGITRRFRFRFINPLMQPYVIMDGLAKELISSEAAEKVLNKSSF